MADAGSASPRSLHQLIGQGIAASGSTAARESLFGNASGHAPHRGARFILCQHRGRLRAPFRARPPAVGAHTRQHDRPSDRAPKRALPASETARPPQAGSDAPAGPCVRNACRRVHACQASGMRHLQMTVARGEPDRPRPQLRAVLCASRTGIRAHRPSSRCASAPVNNFGICCTIRMGTGKATTGRRGSSCSSAAGPPVETPIPTALDRFAAAALRHARVSKHWRMSSASTSGPLLCAGAALASGKRRDLRQQLRRKRRHRRQRVPSPLGLVT